MIRLLLVVAFADGLRVGSFFRDVLETGRAVAPEFGQAMAAEEL